MISGTVLEPWDTRNPTGPRKSDGDFTDDVSIGRGLGIWNMDHGPQLKQRTASAQPTSQAQREATSWYLVGYLDLDR